MKTLPKILLVFLALVSCKSDYLRKNQETILDRISYVKDSIVHQIDSIPPLYESLDTKKRFVDIGDAILFCQLEGNGIPLVLIHGGPGGTSHYFHPWFSKASDFSRVIYYDQRGCGQSDFNPGKNGYSFEQAVDDLDKLRQKLDIDKWILCGYSYGGALAQFYAAIYPENTLGMVLINASPVLKDKAIDGSRQGDYISDKERNRIKEIYRLYQKGNITLQQLLYNKDINGDWKRQNFYKPTKEEFIRSSLYEWVNDKGFNSTMSASFSKYNFKDVFNNCPIPTLICEGKWDLTWSPEKKYLLRDNHPNAEYILFEHSGHNIFYDEPKLFFSNLKHFVIEIENNPKKYTKKWQKHAQRILGSQKSLFERESNFFKLISTKGIENGIAYYQRFNSNNKSKKLFTEVGLNLFGYSYLQQKDYKTALLLFKLNVDANPNSWNVYDSLGEAYLISGDSIRAKENYEKSVQLNPNNVYGKKVLKKL